MAQMMQCELMHNPVQLKLLISFSRDGQMYAHIRTPLPAIERKATEAEPWPYDLVLATENACAVMLGEAKRDMNREGASVIQKWCISRNVGTLSVVVIVIIAFWTDFRVLLLAVQYPRSRLPHHPTPANLFNFLILPLAVERPGQARQGISWAMELGACTSLRSI